MKSPFTDTATNEQNSEAFEPARQKSPMEIERDLMMQKIFDKNKVWNAKDLQSKNKVTRDASFENQQLRVINEAKSTLETYKPLKLESIGSTGTIGPIQINPEASIKCAYRTIAGKKGN